MSSRAAAILGAIFASSCAAFYDKPPTPLADAAWRGDVQAARKLVEGGADINELHGAAMQMAARGGHPIGPHRCGDEPASRPEMIATLLDLGADPNLRDGRTPTPGGSSGWTPLITALHHKQFKSAVVLLEHGADPDIKSDQGISVLDMAEIEGAPPSLLALIKAKSTLER